ncbi:AsmA-like C-terminal region-containing protein [Rubripirellula obstinata]|nr:AsmA-like C-terminal region-containing protein [Rubripirellula obstinata]
MMWTSVAEGQNQAPPAGPRYWTTQWALDDVDVGKLTRRLGAIGIDTGLDLAGKVSVKLEVGIPTTSLRDAAAYRFDGVLTSPTLEIDGIQLKDFRTAVVYRDGVATLKDLSSKYIDRENDSDLIGEIEGSGSAELVPRGEVTAEARFKKLSLAPVSDIVAKLYRRTATEQLPQSGDFSGEVKFNVPLDTVKNIATYQLEGKFSGRGLKVAGLPAANFDADQVRIEQQVLRVDSFTLTTAPAKGFRNAIRLFGNAAIPLSGTGEFQFRVAGDDVPVDAISGLLAKTKADGKIDFRLVGKGKIEAELETSAWKVEGAIASPGLSVAGVDLGVLEHDISWTPTTFGIIAKRDLADLPKSFRLEKLQCDYAIDAQRLKIDRINASLFGGQVNGSAAIPLDSDGELSAKIKIENVRPTIQLTQAGFASEFSAMISAKLDWQVPVNAIDKPVAHQGRATLKLDEITLGGEKVGELKATASATAGDLTLRGNGTLFDGDLSIDTVANLQAADRWSDVSKRIAKTELEFDGVSLSRLFALVPEVQTDLTGTASGKISIIDWGQEGGIDQHLPNADVVLELKRVSHRSRLLSRSIRLVAKLRRDILGIDSWVGDYAGGTARANGRVYLVDANDRIHPRADLRLSANRVDLQRGLWFLGDTAENFQGLGSMTATMAGVGESIRIRGSVDGRELAFYGLSLGSAHSGLAADANIDRLQWSLRFPSVRSRQGGGQVEGELAISSGRRGGRGIDLASRWRTRRVKLSQLAKQLGQANTPAQGEITGNLSLGGKSVRTVDDLAGRFKFQLAQTRGAAIPGLVGVSRFLGPVSLVGQTFDVGAVEGVIGSGAVVIDEFWLGSDIALIQADGKVFLRSGRMDLNALIATGDYRDIAVNFSQLARRYALRSLLPTSAILSVSELLRDRTVVVRVMGRVNSPIIRLQPIETFREEAARFLLREGQRLIVAGITAEAASSLGSQ